MQSIGVALGVERLINGERKKPAYVIAEATEDQIFAKWIGYHVWSDKSQSWSIREGLALGGPVATRSHTAAFQQSYEWTPRDRFAEVELFEEA